MRSPLLPTNNNNYRQMNNVAKRSMLHT